MFYGQWLALKRWVVRDCREWIPRFSLAISDRRSWKERAFWHGGASVSGGAIGGGIAAVISQGSDSWVIFWATIGGAVGAPVILWIGALVFKVRRPEPRFTTFLQNDRAGVPTSHGFVAPVGPQPVGDPWWQVVYPNGAVSDWFQHPDSAGMPVEKKRTGRIVLNFHRQDQQGSFVIKFRGRVKDGGRLLPLSAVRWRFTEESGWNPDS